jgi:hypothetical protein
MSVSTTNAADEVAVAVRTGKTLITQVEVRQRTNDAPILYLQLFNAAAPTVGTTKPVSVVPVPAGNANVDIATGKYTFNSHFGGMYFATALAYAVTTTPDGSTGPDTGDEPQVDVHYEPVG